MIKDLVKVTWLGGPNDGKTFVWDVKRSPYLRVPEIASLVSLMRADEVSATDTMKVRTVYIEKMIENVYDEEGIFEHARMFYVANYNKGLVH